jgi:hypothetical protein
MQSAQEGSADPRACIAGNCGLSTRSATAATVEELQRESGGAAAGRRDARLYLTDPATLLRSVGDGALGRSSPELIELST